MQNKTRRKLANVFALWLTMWWWSAAIALTTPEIVLFGSVAPTVFNDFTQTSALPASLTFTGGTSGSSTCTNASGVIVIQTGPCFDHTPAGAPLGLRTWHAVTNLYLHSNAPATQTVVVASATQYTVSFWGTGTLTLSGACTQVMTGVAATLTSYTCTSSTVALVAADASLTATAYPQVEAAAYAGPRCVTAASSATCTADVPALAGAAATIAAANSGTVIVDAITSHNASSFVSLADAGYRAFINNDNGLSSNTKWIINNGAGSLLGSGSWLTGARVGYTYIGGTSWASGNSSTVASQTYIKPSGSVFLGSNGSATFLDGYIRQIAFFANPISNANLQRLTSLSANLNP